VMGYEPEPDCQMALNVRSGFMVTLLAASVADWVDGATYWPSLFLTEAQVSPDALASAYSTYPMAPAVVLTICATPPLALPPPLFAGQLMVESPPSFQPPGAPSTRNSEKFWVVPEESERRAMVIVVLGSFMPGFCDVIFGSFHLVILAWKMSAMVGASSFRPLLMPGTL